jgi:hypothetical protein
MAGRLLTTAASVQCPHGGVVTGIPRGRVSSGARLLTADDTFTVAGCSFAPSAPSPCVSVRWLVPEARVSVGGARALSMGSVGVCVNAAQAPQGPVVIAQTPARAEAR